MAAFRVEKIEVSPAHESRNASIDSQRVAPGVVHGRNARKKFGVVSFWSTDFSPFQLATARGARNSPKAFSVADLEAG